MHVLAYSLLAYLLTVCIPSAATLAQHVALAALVCRHLGSVRAAEQGSCLKVESSEVCNRVSCATGILGRGQGAGDIVFQPVRTLERCVLFRGQASWVPFLSTCWHYHATLHQSHTHF